MVPTLCPTAELLWSLSHHLSILPFLLARLPPRAVSALRTVAVLVPETILAQCPARSGYLIPSSKSGKRRGPDGQTKSPEHPS